MKQRNFPEKLPKARLYSTKIASSVSEGVNQVCVFTFGWLLVTVRDESNADLNTDGVYGGL